MDVKLKIGEGNALSVNFNFFALILLNLWQITKVFQIIRLDF